MLKYAKICFYLKHLLSPIFHFILLAHRCNACIMSIHYVLMICSIHNTHAYTYIFIFFLKQFILWNEHVRNLCEMYLKDKSKHNVFHLLIHVCGGFVGT